MDTPLSSQTSYIHKPYFIVYKRSNDDAQDKNWQHRDGSPAYTIFVKFKKMYGSLKFKKLHQITKFKNVQLPQNQGCRVLVFCGTPTPGLENLGLQTPTLDSGPKKT